jgi:hypothetical protein
MKVSKVKNLNEHFVNKIPTLHKKMNGFHSCKDLLSFRKFGSVGCGGMVGE